MSSPRIDATPVRGSVDGPLGITLSGFPPRTVVSVKASLADPSGRPWASQASFLVDVDGAADLSTARPVSGSYQAPDATGLVWSLAPAADGRPLAPFEESTLAPLAVSLEAHADGSPAAASTGFERSFVSPDVTVTAVDEAGLVGTLYQPTGSKAARAVLVMGGSAGGQVFSTQTAALLAGHGYAALALAYFGAPGLADALVGIPLETFRRAIDWLLVREGVDASGVAVIGRSRGGELALVLGATFAEIHTVVGVTPSDVMWGGIQVGKMIEASAWSHHGRDLPHLSPRLPPPRMGAIFGKRPIVLRPMFEEGVVDEGQRIAATIQVERIQGSVLLVSGHDDQMWPADRMCQAVVARLERHRHPHRYEHHAYADAGHFFRAPCVPTSVLDSPMFAMGGNAHGQAVANRHAWDKVLSFLAR